MENIFKRNVPIFLFLNNIIIAAKIPSSATIMLRIPKRTKTTPWLKVSEEVSNTNKEMHTDKIISIFVFREISSVILGFLIYIY